MRLLLENVFGNFETYFGYRSPNTASVGDSLSRLISGRFLIPNSNIK
jgi:hypothetical protein